MTFISVLDMDEDLDTADTDDKKADHISMLSGSLVADSLPMHIQDLNPNITAQSTKVGTKCLIIEPRR